MTEEIAVVERWVRHLPSGTLSPVGELDLERFEQDPDYEFLEGPPSEVLATSWEVYETTPDDETVGGWWIRPHGDEGAPVRGPYKSDETALRALKGAEGADVAYVVTPASEIEPEPPADPQE